MTSPDAQTATDVALRYVREEFAAVRVDISGLAGELRAYTTEQGPRVAVLEHRLAEAEKDRASKKDTWRTWGTIAVAVVSVVLAWLLPLISAAGK
jgi:hypothetical protein